MERHIPYLLLKMVFLAFKTLLSPLGVGKKTFLSTLNVMILQMVRNECVRFGGHVNKEVRYKILRFDVL
jgi:ABC-type phosphate transport system ATPase subunit